MNRKSFIRNTLLGLCASLLPEVLRPMDSGYQEFVVEEAGNFYYDINKVVRFKPEPNGKWRIFYNGVTDGKFPKPKTNDTK